MHRNTPENLTEASKHRGRPALGEAYLDDDNEPADKRVVMPMAERYGGHFDTMSWVGKLKGDGYVWTFPSMRQAEKFLREFQSEFDNVPEEDVAIWSGRGNVRTIGGMLGKAGVAIREKWLG